MAAYAALVSLMHITDQIQRHPSPPISIDTQQIESLSEKVTFLQEFLESYSSPFGYSDEVDPLEVRIADAAYAVEDVIESYIVGSIHLAAEISCIHFYEDMQKVIEEIELIKNEVMEMLREKAAVLKPQLQKNASVNSGSRSSSSERNNLMVGFDDVLLQLLDRLTGRNLDRQIIPIVGMGGIGKTTLARSVLANQFIKEHFDICVWSTISQHFNFRETLSEVLSQARGVPCSESEKELGLELYKYLSGRRYLVVMDDMWSLEVWDKMKFFFPDYKNGSRILVTTRLANLSKHLTDSYSLVMGFLDEVSSYNLFSKIVFGEEDFPLQLEKTGKNIVKNCKGLPLAIVVIGGFMAKSQQTEEYWEHVEKNLSSIVSLEDNEYCLRVLNMSYNHLPTYLKPCFLYMGRFEEDRAISVSTLISLWVCEGFLKPMRNKSLEIIAREYLKELVDRNLILVHELGSLGDIKCCKIHDLLRDLSLKEAEKQRFYHVLRDQDSHSPRGRRGVNSQRGIIIPRSTSEEIVRDALESVSHARSYVCHSPGVRQLPDLRLLRTLDTHDRIAPVSNKYLFSDGVCNKYWLTQVFRLVNLRYLDVVNDWDSEIPSSIKLLWNLHTLLISSRNDLTAPIEIWRMHQLRHVEFTNGRLYLPNPPEGDNDIVILENVHTLIGVKNLYLNEGTVKRIPNIEKLCMYYVGRLAKDINFLSHLQRLSKLETFCCTIEFEQYPKKINFPNSLKKLSLIGSFFLFFELEDILQEIGLLPLLEKLEVQCGFFRTRTWEISDGQFPRLKLLDLRTCADLEDWTMSESLPLLHHLRLGGLRRLKKIPLEIGETSTLKSIELRYCSESAVVSAKKIVELQEDLYGEPLDLRVRVVCRRSEARALQYLGTPNFHFQV